MKLITHVTVNRRPKAKGSFKRRTDGDKKVIMKMQGYMHIEPRPEIKKPFRTRVDVEEKMKRILDLIEQGNLARAEYEAHMFSWKLEQMIKKIKKGKLRIKPRNKIIRSW